MANQYDAIVIGAGHNGLVAAAYLAKAGRKVLVVERRAIVGGQLVSEDFGNGFIADALHPGGQLRPDILRDLGLPAQAATGKPVYRSLQGGGASLDLVADPTDASTLESIRKFSAKDAAAWPQFIAFMNKATGFLDAAYRTVMPRMPISRIRSEGLPLALLGLKLRRLGGKDMFRIIRALPMTAVEFAEEWFESEVVRAAVAALGIHGQTMGVMSAGTGYTLMHNWLNRGGLAHAPFSGGASGLSAALASVASARGVEIRTSARVSAIVVEHSRATGVRLDSGEIINAGLVMSGADPRHSLLDLVGAAELPPDFVWHAQSIKMRGSVAKLHLLTDGQHGLPQGTLAVAPSLRYLERAYDAAKYGEVSQQPYLEVTTAGNVVSVHFQFAPYALRNGDWNTQRERVEKTALATLAPFFPALQTSVKQLQTITPLDLETTYGLTEGDMNHGQLLLDQFFFLRPLPGYSNHKTPIDGLYLCGSGVHGGGGISGASGRNAAKTALKA